MWIEVIVLIKMIFFENMNVYLNKCVLNICKLKWMIIEKGLSERLMLMIMITDLQVKIYGQWSPSVNVNWNCFLFFNMIFNSADIYSFCFLQTCWIVIRYTVDEQRNQVLYSVHYLYAIYCIIYKQIAAFSWNIFFLFALLVEWNVLKL